MTKIHRQEELAKIVSMNTKLNAEFEEARVQRQTLLDAMAREKVRKPLTNEQIYECYRAEFDIMLTDSGAQNTIKQFARAIERAHGIGVEDE